MNPNTEPNVPLNDPHRAVVDGRVDIDQAIAGVLDSGWYVRGRAHDAFLSELASFLDVPHLHGVGNGTDALEIAMRAAMPEGKTTVMTAANCGGYSATAARAAGFGVRYADVLDDTLCLDPESVAERMTSDVGVIVVTHLYGRAADVEPFLTIAKAWGAIVLEDCAQSIGASIDGRRTGSLGDIATFSFYPTKNLGALGDGGAVATSSPRLSEAVARLSQYGWDGKYAIACVGGRNSRLDEIQAAVLRTRLPLVDGWNAARRAIIARYARSAPATVRVLEADGPSHAGHLAVVRTSSRQELSDHLASLGIRTDVHYPIPDHKQAGFAAEYAEVSLPVTEAASREILSVPCFPEMTAAEIERVADGIASFR